ncbi:hypothetical protein PBV52_45310 [Streptomyces sp. T12]|uniref:hypothetical protein n=1 Tax=Streptomyces sp. T12 TaxID=477697 RepID=UPI002366CBF1|nr:hypothetical protein [Streptomyces sp. T12]WDF43496.1 hypothetical protein PBV52_45310 [Streptomyces sp. T12]
MDASAELEVAVALRVTEDRNGALMRQLHVWFGWRSPFGATEDRNFATFTAVAIAWDVAVVLRGDRGSQPRHRERHRPWRAVAIALRGD